MAKTELNLLKATVGHHRSWPKKNSFNYKVFYVNTPVLEDMNNLATSRLFSFNRWNILSLHTRDYGAKDKTISWHSFITDELKKAKIPFDKDYKINLISHPRLFGYAFNPISYWLVTDKTGFLRAVMCEVHNTFGDTHNYLLHKPDNSPIIKDDVLTAQKQLYVSPFNKTEGSYDFTFLYTETKFTSTIKYYDAQHTLVDTYMGGEFANLTSRNITRSVLSYPFMTVLVVAKIHWQAVKLYFKKVPHTLKVRDRNYKSNRTTVSDKQKTK